MSNRKGYKTTRIGDMPEDWETTQTVDICKGTTERFLDGDWILTKDLEDVGDVRLIQLSNIGEGLFIDESKRWVSSEKCSQLQCTLLKPRDILVSRMADPVARSCILPVLPYRCITAVDVSIVRPNEKEYDTRLVNYLFNSKIVRYQAQSASAGATRPRISRTNLEKLLIPKPPIQEQRKIASILSTVDDAIQKTDEIIARTQQLKKGLMQQLLTKGIGHTKFKQTEIGEIPEEWRVVSFGDISTIQNGRFFPSEHYIEDGIKLLRPGNLHEDGFVEWNQANTKCLPAVYAETAREWIVKGGEIVMNLTAQSLEDEFLGRACMTRDDEYCLLNQRIARISSQDMDQGFLFWVLKSRIFRRFADALPGGTKIKHIYGRDLRRFRFPCPPLIEQKEIAKILFEVTQKVACEKDGRAKLLSLKKALISVLLTGKVRVKVD